MADLERRYRAENKREKRKLKNADSLAKSAIDERRDTYDHLLADVKGMISPVVQSLKENHPDDGVLLEFVVRPRSKRKAQKVGWLLGTGRREPPRDSYGVPGQEFGWYALTDNSVRQVDFLGGLAPQRPQVGRAGHNVIDDEYRKEKPLRGKFDLSKRDSADTTRILNERLIGTLRQISRYLNEAV